MQLKTMKQHDNQDNSASIFILFFILSAITVFSAFVLAFIYSIFPHQNVSDTSVLLPGYVSDLHPKPQEHFVFIILILTIPLSAFLLALTVFNKNKLARKLWPIAYILDSINQRLQKCTPVFIKTKLHKNKPHIIVVGALLLLTLPLLSYLIYFPFLYVHGEVGLSDAMRHLDPEFILVSIRTFVFLSLTFFSVKYWYTRQYLRVHSGLSKCGGYCSLITWIICIAAILLQIGAFRIYNELAITNERKWDVHFDAVIYSIGQVMGGKTLLIDLPSQYGLYPELLRPLFKVINFSVLNLLAFFAVLQSISLLSICWVISRVVHDRLIRFLFAIALLTISYGTYMYILDTASGEPLYYQYFPIRFFWPALSVIAFYGFSKKPTLWNLLLISMVGAVGTIWNLDTGLMIVLAFAGVLVGKWLAVWSSGSDAYRTERRQVCYALLIHFSLFIVICTLMLSYLFLKGHGSINVDWLFKYQKIFYDLGFCLESLPLFPHPWMSVIGVYLMGIIMTARLWVSYPLSKKADLLGFLSLLGLGLFVYYSGRSTNFNLIASCWPALCIVAILADNALRGMRAGLLSHEHVWLPSAVLTIIILLSVPFALGVVKMGQDSISRFKSRNIPANEIVSNELQFIREHSKPGDECVILSAHQGFYYAATKMASPIPGPGFIELLLKVERDHFVDHLAQNKYGCVFVGLDGSAVDLGVDLLQAIKGYNVIAMNSKKSMLYLTSQHLSTSPLEPTGTER